MLDLSVAGLIPTTIFGVNTAGWLLPLLVFLGTYFLLWIFKRILLIRVKKISEKTATKIDDAFIAGLESVGWPFYVFASLYVAIQFTQLPAFFSGALQVATLVIIVFYAVKILQKILEAVTQEYVEKRANEKMDSSIVLFASKFASYALWLLAALLVLENAGYDITALVAGLGVVGIAIALAVQNILSDIFSSLSIYFDKPFKVGDFLILGNEMGTVKKIGIKTTRIQALQGEEIIISNKELTESRIHNFGKMEKRRVVFSFGITYETPPSKIKMVNQIVKKSVEKINGATLDRVHFKSFGDFSLLFEVVYYLPTADYNAYMDSQQSINYSLIEDFRANKIEFAYPTQKIFVAK